jgi:hypothetical protein
MMSFRDMLEEEGRPDTEDFGRIFRVVREVIREESGKARDGIMERRGGALGLLVVDVHSVNNRPHGRLGSSWLQKRGQERVEVLFIPQNK